MRKTGFLLLSILSINVSLAGGISQSEYADIFALQGKESKSWQTVMQCLGSWPKHPFDTKALKFRVIESNVRVFGIGSNTTDEVTTNYPQLILVQPAVNVMSKITYNLKNQNGWYCLKGQTNVMGKAIFNVGCKTHITSSESGSTVMGSSEGESGTTVMGKTVINRVCK